MKKIAIASLIALAATAASAMELGVGATRDYSGTTDRDGASVSLTQRYDKVGVTAGFDRFTKGENDQDRYSLVLGYDAAKLGTITVTPKVGASYLRNQTGDNGYAVSVGVGATLPVTKELSIGLDAMRHYGQERVQSFDGNLVTLGLRYKF